MGADCGENAERNHSLLNINRPFTSAIYTIRYYHEMASIS
jgi:hypothetical protein